MKTSSDLKMAATLFGKKGSRRDFLRNPAATALATSPLAACVDESSPQQSKLREEDHSGGTIAPMDVPLPRPSARGIESRGVRQDHSTNREVGDDDFDQIHP